MNTPKYLNNLLILQDIHQVNNLILRIIALFSLLNIFIKHPNILSDKCLEG